jgi:WD40 repeat protein
MGERLKDLRAIFLNALEIEDREQRKAYLDDACQGDEKLRADVEGLLKAHERAGDFLEAPLVASNATLDSLPRIDGPGAVIGRYQLLELIGEGGMGLVYLAEQKEPVRRKVAFKIIKPGMDSKQVIARFEAERQALAVLDHPNIAHVFDASCTETGRPYFVMEHVRGMSITRYCDEHKLTIEQRLRLFEQVCEAVQHAHQKGIIHRDLKPSNILVTVQGDKPVPKIIDFGIAKAITSPLTDMTFVTLQGQLLGTPEYMSPEQVDLAAQDIDTRSDIYSLGVVLYELLAGVLPFGEESFAKAGLAEIQQTIREQEPASPSVRLTQIGDRAKGIAASRGTQVVPLARRLHRELEWIPLKAMRKDRCRRYRSASEMADDVHNYLTGRPLLAGPETALYRVQKFVRKHAGSVATVALVATAIVLGLVVSTTMYLRAEDARQKEAAARTQAEQATKKETVARAEAEQAREKETVARTQAEQAERATKAKAEELRRTLYANNIQLADAKYREGNISVVCELLGACPADLRGWEWNRLNYIHDQSLMTLAGHRDIVRSSVFSPAGDRIATGSHDKTVKVWDARTGAVLMTLRGHEDRVYLVSFSPDGTRIATGSKDGTIRIWDAEDGKQLAVLTHGKGVWSVAFSPDGKRIFSSGEDNTIKVWDAANGSELMTVPTAYEEGGTCMTLSPEGTRIASFSPSGSSEFQILDATTGDEIVRLAGHKEDGENSLAFSGDARWIASAGNDDTVKLWDVGTGSEVATIRAHEHSVECVAFSPDGRRLASASWDQTVKIWDVETKDELLTLRGHESPISFVAFSPDGKRLVSAGYDGSVKVWNAETALDSVTLLGHTNRVDSLAFSFDGRRLASGCADGTIKIWDAADGRELMTLDGHNGSVTSLCFAPSGEALVSGGVDGTIRLWNAQAGSTLMTLVGHQDYVGSVAISADGKHIVSGGDDKALRIWDVQTGRELMTLRGHEGSVTAVAFSPDGKRIISGSSDETVKVWDATTGAEVMTLPGHVGRVSSVAFDRNGGRIISGSYDYTLRVWDAMTGAEVMKLRGHRDRVLSVAISPDGKRIASGSQDMTVKVWDADSGLELMTLRGHKGYVSCVRFSPDGGTIASSSGDRTIRLWKSGKSDE